MSKKTALIKYKSLKTIERLKLVRSDQPLCELATKKELDDKFKEFSEKAQLQLFPETALITPKYDIQKQRNIKYTTTESKISQTNHSLKQSNIYDVQTNNLIDKETSDIEMFKSNQTSGVFKGDPITFRFGQLMISAIFQGLTINCIDVNYVILIVKNVVQKLLNQKNKITEEQLTPAQQFLSNLLQVFDLNLNHLNNLSTLDEKNKYIFTSMTNVINQLLKTWKDKAYLKERKYKEIDFNFNQELKSEIGNKQFKWLQVRTKYESLKNKLRSIIIDKLNDYENQTSAIELLAQSQLKKTHGNQKYQVNLFLKNVKLITTRDLFENMGKNGQSSEAHLLKSLGTDRLKKIRERTEGKNSQSTVENQEEKIQEQPPQYVVEWNENQEKVFQNQRATTKQLFTYEVSSSNWNDIGYLPVMHQLSQIEKKKLQRDHILNRYANGDWLTAQELQFLANTSKLLNNCLDKKFFQKATNIIDNDLLQNMELNLAENILTNYEQMKNIISQARLNYIRQKMIKTKQKIEQNIIIEEKKQLKEQNLEFNRKYVKIFTTVIHHMDRLGKFEEKIPNEVPGAKLLHQYLKGKITSKELISKLKYLKEMSRASFNEDGDSTLNGNNQSQSKDFYNGNGKQQNQDKITFYRQMSRPKSSLTPGFQKEVTRHKYHPSSKLFIKSKENEEQELLGYLSKLKDQYNSKEQVKFQLHLKSHPALRFSKNFQGFYSGGPTKQVETQMFNLYNKEEKEKQQISLTNKELQAIILIQRKMKSVLKEKRMRQQMQNRQKEIYFFFKDNCDIMMNIIDQEQHDPQLQNILLSRQIERAREVAQQNLGLIKNEEQQKSRNQEVEQDDQKVEERKSHGRQLKLQSSTSHSNFLSNLKSQQHSSFDRSDGGSTTAYQTPSHINSSQLTQFISYNNQKNKKRWDVLFEAAQKGKFMIILQTKLVFSVQDINHQNINGYTPLHFVVKHGEHQFIQWLLDNGAKVNMQNNNGDTPLHFAFKKDKLEIILLLINNGGNINLLNNQDQSPLSFASGKVLRLLNIGKEFKNDSIHKYREK